MPSFDRTPVEGPLLAAIWRIAWPTLVQNIVFGFQGLVDHVLVGHYVGFLGNAAIGVSWQVFLVLVVFGNSLYGGVAVLVARFAGANEPDKVGRAFFQGLLGTTFLAVVVFPPFGYFLAPTLLDLVHAEPRVQVEALPYLRLLCVFGLGGACFFLFCGALRAAGDARTPLRLGIVMTLVNIALSLVLIRGLGPIPAFGTAGAALGTVGSGATISAYAVFLLVTRRLVIRLPERLVFRPDWSVLGAILRFGVPTGLQNVVMNLGVAILIRFVGSLEQSAEAQAAFAVSYTQLFSFIMWSSAALHTAAATMTGQNLGAGQPDRATRAPLACTAVGLLIASPVALAFLFFPETLLGLFGIRDVAVLGLGRQLLAYLSISSLLVVAALSYTGALQGGGDTKSPFYISLVAQLALPLGMCTVLELMGSLEPGDIWLALLLGHLARFLLSAWRFHQGKWKGIDVSLKGGAAEG